MAIPTRMRFELASLMLINYAALERKVLGTYSRKQCAQCGDPIPPGKAGRKCKVCRDTSRTTKI